jgi:hypothetical protein
METTAMIETANQFFQLMERIWSLGPGNNDYEKYHKAHIAARYFGCPVSTIEEDFYVATCKNGERVQIFDDGARIEIAPQ